MTVWAAHLAPGLVDRYLARKGVDDQQSARPASAHPDDNLDVPFDDAVDRGVHGPLDDETKDREITSTVTHRGRLIACLGALMAGGAVAIARSRTSRRSL